MRRIAEAEFKAAIRLKLSDPHIAWNEFGAVTGPGRSGAVASVYASHILGLPFIPSGAKHPRERGRLLIIDTAVQTGKSLRKAAARYQLETPLTMAIFDEKANGRVVFWYEKEDPPKRVEDGGEEDCPDCGNHSVYTAAGGGVICRTPACGYWFCH